ncbi:hypothetical protein [Leisingera sp. NJS201]|uniref:hypothetical protein n=1 Tax=Leisingera sp. NJS201 TaxID=2508306 RepID=UPI00142FFAE5|nr:hypothetical protein [Leisingera sp. NJS201]
MDKVDTLLPQASAWPPSDGPVVALIDGSGLGICLLILFLFLTCGMIFHEGSGK